MLYGIKIIIKGKRFMQIEKIAETVSVKEGETGE